MGGVGWGAGGRALGNALATLPVGRRAPVTAAPFLAWRRGGGTPLRTWVRVTHSPAVRPLGTTRARCPTFGVRHLALPPRSGPPPPPHPPRAGHGQRRAQPDTACFSSPFDSWWLGLAPEIPEDLYHLIKKAVSVRKHLERNRKDRDAKFRLILIESRVHRLARYYKRNRQLPPNWK